VALVGTLAESISPSSAEQVWAVTSRERRERMMTMRICLSLRRMRRLLHLANLPARLRK
jgi:hypothetical protein